MGDEYLGEGVVRYGGGGFLVVKLVVDLVEFQVILMVLSLLTCSGRQ